MCLDCSRRGWMYVDVKHTLKLTLYFIPLLAEHAGKHHTLQTRNSGLPVNVLLEPCSRAHQLMSVMPDNSVL